MQVGKKEKIKEALIIHKTPRCEVYTGLVSAEVTILLLKPVSGEEKRKDYQSPLKIISSSECVEINGKHAGWLPPGLFLCASRSRTQKRVANPT